MHQLLSEEMRPSLLALCGVIAVADGELCWPLPGHTYISCHFGEVDAFGNAGHRGTDIPAPEGTPILAAHSGTVLVSGWNDSYGNQVLLDNGAGLSTRYAHMTQTAVTAGEAVTAGQVIGYVGNTGDSTGFHLHFEVTAALDNLELRTRLTCSIRLRISASTHMRTENVAAFEKIAFFCSKCYNRYIPNTEGEKRPCQDRHGAVEFVAYHRSIHSSPTSARIPSLSC